MQCGEFAKRRLGKQCKHFTLRYDQSMYYVVFFNLNTKMDLSYTLSIFQLLIIILELYALLLSPLYITFILPLNSLDSE